VKVAICLLTADRPAYTADTVLSYLNKAEEPGHIRLHADDGSERRDNLQIAAAGGFDTVYATNERRGPVAAVKTMWTHAAALGATHILHLENDIELVAALPRFDVECVRLYGDRKARTGPRQMVGPHRMGTKDVIKWTEEFADFRGNRWYRGRAHWSGMPSITRTELLLRAIVHAETFKDISLTLNAMDTLRPRDNLAWHVGDARTPGAKYNQ